MRLIDGIAQVLEAGGSFGVTHDPERSDPASPWSAGIHARREAPDSDMCAAAGYGLGSTAAEAITGALADFGIEVDL